MIWAHWHCLQAAACFLFLFYFTNPWSGRRRQEKEQKKDKRKRKRKCEGVNVCVHAQVSAPLPSSASSAVGPVGSRSPTPAGWFWSGPHSRGTTSAKTAETTNFLSDIHHNHPSLLWSSNQSFPHHPPPTNQGRHSVTNQLPFNCDSSWTSLQISMKRDFWCFWNS